MHVKASQRPAVQNLAAPDGVAHDGRRAVPDAFKPRRSQGIVKARKNGVVAGLVELLHFFAKTNVLDVFVFALHRPPGNDERFRIFRFFKALRA